MSTVHITSEDYQNILLEVGKAQQRGQDALIKIEMLETQLAAQAKRAEDALAESAAIRAGMKERGWDREEWADPVQCVLHSIDCLQAEVDSAQEDVQTLATDRDQWKQRAEDLRELLRRVYHGESDALGYEDEQEFRKQVEAALATPRDPAKLVNTTEQEYS